MSDKDNPFNRYASAVISFYDSEGNHNKTENIIVSKPLLDINPNSFQVTLTPNPDDDGIMIQLGKLPEKFTEGNG